MAHRYEALPGSAFDVQFGGPYDIVLLTNFLHHFDLPTCVGLLKRVHAALRPGGRVAALEFVPNEDRVSPPMAAAFSTLHQNGGTFIQDAMSQAKAGGDAFLPTFQVVDALTAQAAYEAGGGELVAIDLTEQAIRHTTGIEITHSGEVNVEAAGKSPLPSVTYILPETWTFQPL